MMEHEHFLQAILADPESDTPRLIYADWLEEQGDPRGEFIRVQCECASLPYGHERREMLLRRETQMLQEADLLESLLDLCIRVDCRRGFVEKVSLSAADFLDHAAVLHSSEAIRGLHLQDPQPSQLPRLAAMPELNRFTLMDLSGNALAVGDVLELLSGPHLAQVNALGLNQCGYDDEDVQQLADSGQLHRIIALHLGFNRISQIGALALASSLHLGPLQWLDLFGNLDLFQHEPTYAIRALQQRFGDRVRL